MNPDRKKPFSVYPSGSILPTPQQMDVRKSAAGSASCHTVNSLMDFERKLLQKMRSHTFRSWWLSSSRSRMSMQLTHVTVNGLFPRSESHEARRR